MGPNEAELIWLVVIGSAMFLILSIALVIFFFIYQRKIVKESIKSSEMKEQFNRELVRSVINSQENERRKIAANVHDNLSSLLYLAKLRLSSIENVPDMSEIDGVSRLLDECIDVSKKIARELIPTSIPITGLSGAVKDYFSRIPVQGIRANFIEQGLVQELSVDESLNVYRVIQELVSNSLKHADCSKIELEFVWFADRLTISYSDNGKGYLFPQHDRLHATGLGVLNIMGRLDMIHAKILRRGQCERGFRFEFEISY